MSTENILRNKYNAKIASTRGRVDKNGVPIEMHLSYDEWATLWHDAGKMPGRTYVLSRKNDLGHYEIGNVYVNHQLHNAMESHPDYNAYEKQISDLAISTGYKRRTIKRLIKCGLFRL